MFLTDRIFNETVITLTEAAREAGVSRNTIQKWIHDGLGGVVLETASVGSQYRTSKEALKRFHKSVERAKHPRVENPKGAERMRKETSIIPLDGVDKMEVYLDVYWTRFDLDK